MRSRDILSICLCAKIITLVFSTFLHSLPTSTMLQAIRSISLARAVTSKPARSHIKSKLEHFLETGEVQKQTPYQAAKKSERFSRQLLREAEKSRYSPQKALLMLRAKYDSTLLQTKNQKIDLQRLKPLDLSVDSSRLREIFDALMEVKRVDRKRLNDKLVLVLLGSSPEQLKDPFVVTKDVLKLLERDQDVGRAVYLCRMAQKNGVVGMNAVLQWCLEHGKQDEAQRCFNDRKKWAIPCNEQTYIHYFSGMAKSHEWGQVSDKMTDKCIELFGKMDVKPTVEIFNACLSLVVKNFTAHQEKAWEFFEQLEAQSLSPTSQLFTIFLNGCKKFHHSECQRIRADHNITSSDRANQLFRAQANLIETANMVLEKIMAAAVPPVPPTKEQAEQDPELLETYRKQVRRVLMDIDPVFAATFVSCFINNSAGTAQSTTLGSHYAYLQEGLAYLQMWCPEIESMMHYIGSQIEPSPETRKRTDERALGIEAPQFVAPTREKANPLVIFPPPAFSSNKTKAIFSGKQKRLVDFARPTFSDIHKLVLHRNFETSRGKFGKKLRGPMISLERGDGVNRFLLHLALDGLIKLGLHREFYLGMWYSLTKWGGLYASRTDLLKLDGLQCGALPKSEYPVVKVESSNKSTREEKEDVDGAEKFPVKEDETKVEALKTEGTPLFTTIPLVKRSELTQPHKNDIMDIMLVENFIYKMEENFPHLAVPARFAAELVAAIVSHESNVWKTLKPRDKTFDALFSMLNRDVHLYNDKNWHQGLAANRRKELHNNTPKRSITFKQLNDVLDPLGVLMQSIMVHEGRVYGHHARRKALMLNRFVESYSLLISTLYKTTWWDVPDNSKEVISVHKKILAAGIFFYRPQALIDPRDKIVYSNEILNSLEFVYRALKDDKNLTQNDKKLMVSLRTLFQLDTKKPDAVEWLQSLQWKIYRLCLV